MRTTVVVFGSAALQRVVDEALLGTSACSVRYDVTAVAPAAILESAAAIVVDDGIADTVVSVLIKRVAADERYRWFVVRDVDVDIAVDWTVVRRSEVVRGVQTLVADAEAVVVELLARVRDRHRPDEVARFGCVVSVASSFVLATLDHAPDDVSLAFVLPAEGRITIEGRAVPVPGRVGLFRVRPVDETVRAALLRFTIRRAETFDDKMGLT